MYPQSSDLLRSLLTVSYKVKMNNKKGLVKRTMRSLSVQEKLNAIERVHKGSSKAEVARDIGVPESTLRGWCKSEQKLRSSLDQREPTPPIANVPPPDVPLDFSHRSRPSPDSEKILRNCKMNECSSGETKTDDDIMCWTQPGQQTMPLSPREAPTADSASWFWKLYKNNGIPQLNNAKIGLPSTESEDSSSVMALYHGEKFLNWLEFCSDPSITAFHILQFRSLLDNVRHCVDRHRNGRVSKPPRPRTSRK